MWKLKAPKTAKTKSMVRGRSFGNSTQNSTWQSIIDNLDNLLITLQENYVRIVLSSETILTANLILTPVVTSPIFFC